MHRRQLGKTDLQISVIGFGCSRIGGMSATGVRRKDVVRLLHAACDRGITFFDTADAYAQGDSERLLGEAFHDRRDRIVIATKGGYLFEDTTSRSGPLGRAVGVAKKAKQRVESRLLGRKRQFAEQDFSREYLTRAVEASLRRLRTDTIDLYQLHAPRSEQARTSDVIETLGRLQQAGKIRYFGVGLEALDAVPEWLHHSGLSCLQIPFGLLDLEARTAVLPAVARAQMGLIARGVYGGGLLKPTLSQERLRKLTPKWQRIDEFHRIAARAHRPIDELALHYVLGQPEVSAVLLGMRTLDHLEGNLRCLAQRPIEPEFLQAIQDVNTRLPLENG